MKGFNCCYLLVRLTLATATLFGLLIGLVMAVAALSTIAFEGVPLKPLFIFLLVCGLLITTLAFLGCCGSVTQSRCLLSTFLLSLLIVISAQFIFVILLFFKEIDIVPELRSEVRRLVLSDYNTNNTATVMVWDTLQREIGCCGYSGPVDWATSVFNNYEENSKEIGIGTEGSLVAPFQLPVSCCREEQSSCVPTIIPKLQLKINENEFYTKGCLVAIEELFLEHKHLVSLFIFIIFFIELLMVFITCNLFCAIKKKEMKLGNCDDL